MSTESVSNWYSDNQSYLMMALDEIKHYLKKRPLHPDDVLDDDHEKYLKQSSKAEGEADELAHIQDASVALLQSMAAPPALESLCANLGLSKFERAILLMCAGMELDGSFASICSAADKSHQRHFPTFGLAMAMIPDASWESVIPTSPLRLWRLIEVGEGDTLMSSPLRIDERIVHYLAGLDYVDERLKQFVRPLLNPHALCPSHQAIATQLTELWTEGATSGDWPVVQLCGNENVSKLAVISAATQSLGIQACVLQIADIPASITERQSLLKLWQREVLLSGTALVVECDEAETHALLPNMLSLIEYLSGPLVINRRDPFVSQKRSVLRLDVAKPDNSEQYTLWQQGLGALANKLNGELEKLVDQFSLASTAIQAVSVETLADPSTPSLPATEVSKRLWHACRKQARLGLDDLAQRIEPKAGWDDLVLPDAQKQTLRQAVAHVRHRRQVYEHWGLADKSNRGLGISALLAGVSGTGKTMAAEVVSGELALDLYRIDLSSVVSKYIGETEKNLRRIFDAAEEASAILLFDEADALFGKRSEVKDSHDRYANIEVSYLLQRMETYAGLSILTTNLKSALDTAFLRRIRFIVQFPFPDAEQRNEIWSRIYPGTIPTNDLRYEKLSRLNVTGGNIKNIAMNAAFLAAEANEPVSMTHMLSATRSEYIKLDKPLTDSEIAGWITSKSRIDEGAPVV